MQPEWMDNDQYAEYRRTAEYGAEMSAPCTEDEWAEEGWN